MIIFTAEEYKKWSELSRQYAADCLEARKLRGLQRDRKLADLENDYINDQDRIEAPAHERTIKGFSNQKLFEDTQAAIFYDVYRQFAEGKALQDAAEKNGLEYEAPAGYEPGTKDDLRIFEQIDELNRRPGSGELWEQIKDLWERYEAGQIDAAETLPYKDYEPIRIEIIAPKGTGEEPGEELQTVTTVFPKEFLMPKDKVTNKIFEEGALTPDVLTDVIVGSRNGKQLTTSISINYNGLDDVQLLNRPKGLTAYDQEVNDAVLTLTIGAGNPFFTEQMIYRAMTGNPAAKLKEPARQQLAQSLLLLQGTLIVRYINPEERTAYPKLDNLPDNDTTYLLPIESATRTIKGQRVTGYRLIKTPYIYEYAEAKGQIARAPIAMLNTSVRKDSQTIEIQGYLLRRIKSMGKTSNTILLSTVYDRLNLLSGLANDTQRRKKRSKVNKTILTILEEWKGNGFINDYAPVKKGTTLEKILVDP